MGRTAILGVDRLTDATILVTGASSGISMEIARQVGSRAKAIVLVARRVERLEELKGSLLESNSALRVETIP